MNISLTVRKYLFATLLAILSVTTSSAQTKEQTLHDLNTLLINTVMTDNFTPIVSSRIYVYPNIAFYECMRYDDPSMSTLSGKLNGLNQLPAPPANKKIDNFIAACVSFSHVAQTLVGSEYKFSDWRKSFADSLFKHGDSVLTQNSILFG